MLAPMATASVAAAPAEVHAPPAIPDFEIVPKKGLPIVAVVLIGLVVAVESDKLWPVEFFHVAFGAIWTAFDLFLGLVLGPILGRLSVPARIEMTTRLMPKMVLIMPTVVVCTLVAGWQLGGFVGPIYQGAPHHDLIVVSYVIVGIMAIIALSILEPANVAVLFELKKPRPNPAVIEHLMKRFIYTAGILGAMQVATLVIMTKVGAA
jgi:hypothetical protein